MLRIVDLLASLLLGLAACAFAAVPLLHRFIHGDYDRHMWLIRGPRPFDQFGSGPFQLWMHVELILLGVLLLGTGLLLRRWWWRQVAARYQGRPDTVPSDSPMPG